MEGAAEFIRSRSGLGDGEGEEEEEWVGVRPLGKGGNGIGMYILVWFVRDMGSGIEKLYDEEGCCNRALLHTSDACCFKHE